MATLKITKTKRTKKFRKSKTTKQGNKRRCKSCGRFLGHK